MSNYFYERIKNLPTGVSSTNSGIGYRQNASAAWPTAKKLDAPANVTDDELLESVLQFEKTPQFKRAEEEAKQERGKPSFIRLPFACAAGFYSTHSHLRQ